MEDRERTHLSDLKRIVGKARVDGSARSTNGRAQRVGQGRHDFVKVFLVLDAPAARDDPLGGPEVGPLQLGQALAHPFGRV